MVRKKLAAAILSTGFLLPGLSMALGVGDYELRSYLNQPLNLEIDLLQTADLGTEEVLAGLAKQEDFDRAGVERLYFLTDLHFEVVQRPDGTMSVRVTSDKPVNEPFLNFLVEVQWPQGRLLREYTILLDPPVYKAAAPTATAEPVVISDEMPPLEPAPAIEPVAQSEYPPPPSPVGATTPAYVPPAQPSPAQPSYAAAAPGDYQVQKGDTLWEIAQRNRTGGANVQQTMIAIQRANQDAFIDGNINLVKKGHVLRIPGEAEIQQVSTAEAASEVASQNRAWRELLDRRGVVLPTGKAQIEGGRDVVAAAPAKRGTGAGEVTLVTPQADGKGGKAAGLEALQNKLAIAEENLDKAARENKELASRLGDLESQVGKGDKLVKLKDNQIAQLQEELNRLRAEKGLAPVEAPAAPAAPAEAAPAVAGEEKPAAEEKPVAEEKPTQKPKADKPKAEKPAARQGPGLALYAALGAGLLALLGGAFWFLRKRRAQQGEVAGREESAEVEAEVSDDLAQLEDLAAFAGGGEDEDLGAAPAEAESSSDPIGEADMYMAYGRFQQAADILYAALQREPDRDDIRMKLAEVYAEMGDEASAREQATALQATHNTGIRQQADALLARLGGGVATAAAATAATASAEEEMPSLDDLAMEFSGGGDEPAQAAAEEEFTFDTDATEESLDFSLDDIDMGEAPAPASAAPAAKTSSLGELSLDDAGLGEFTLDEEPVAAPAEEELTLEDAGLEEFTLEDQPAETQDAAAEFSLEDEFSLEEAGGESVLELPDVEAPTAVQPRLEETAVRPALAPAADLEADLADLEADLSTEGAAEGGDDFDFLADSDENATKLDLARAYIDMGDADGARDILNEVVADGNAGQKADAQKLLSQLG